MSRPATGSADREHDGGDAGRWPQIGIGKGEEFELIARVAQTPGVVIGYGDCGCGCSNPYCQV